MEVRAVTKYVHMSPQKVRLVADLVRGASVTKALDVLKFTPKAAAQAVRGTLASAAANAEENYGLSPNELYVATIMVDEAPTQRRYRAGARGRYKPVLKRSSHITVVVADREA
ncbi:MAG: 50S ribosomal protein L22 [Chloroflexi bacterium]|nr:50S ribosomal protein L22 [Chloroflexota bacterium]